MLRYIYDVLVIFVSFNLIDNGSRTRISTAIVKKKVSVCITNKHEESCI